MAVPVFGATGMDKSDPASFGLGSGQLAPSSMGASEGFREQVSQRAVDLAEPDANDERVIPGMAAGGLDQTAALRMLREASGQSRSFFETYVHNRWERSYRAFNNEHFAGSLYLQDAYRKPLEDLQAEDAIGRAQAPGDAGQGAVHDRRRRLSYGGERQREQVSQARRRPRRAGTRTMNEE